MAQVRFVETPEFEMEKKLSKGTMAAMHYHHAFELYYLLRGDREYFIGDRFYKVQEGDLVLIPRQILHRTAGKTGSRYLVYFSDGFLTRFFSREVIETLALGAPFVFRPSSEAGGTVARLFEEMWAQYQRDASESNEALLAGYLFRILSAATHTQNEYASSAYSDGRIEAIVRYINENYASIDSLEVLAERFFLSKFYFCRLFTKNLGISVTSYLNTIKIRAACTMLRSGTLSLTEIATRCGFNSSSYFCKVFKAETGISPSTYRKMQK